MNMTPDRVNTLMAESFPDACGRRTVVGTVKLWVDDRPDRLVSLGQGTSVRPTSG
jgi:acyl-coenzyme A thioesterase PaaI-like protein